MFCDVEGYTALSEKLGPEEMYGLCDAGCKHQAPQMERKRDVQAPPANFAELGARVFQDRGKLEAFREVMKPAVRLSVTE